MTLWSYTMLTDVADPQSRWIWRPLDAEVRRPRERPEVLAWFQLWSRR